MGKGEKKQLFLFLCLKMIVSTYYQRLLSYIMGHLSGSLLLMGQKSVCLIKKKINGTKVRFPEKKKRFMGQMSVCLIKKKIDSEYSLPR